MTPILSFSIMFEEFSTGLKLYIWIASGIAIFFSISTLIVIPIVITRLRVDFFSNPKRSPAPWRHQYPLVNRLLYGLKNVLGVLLVLIGLLMLVGPGQGTLTILVGIIMMDYPGKNKTELWIITRKPVWHAAAWLRNKAKVPPFKYPIK